MHTKQFSLPVNTCFSSAFTLFSFAGSYEKQNDSYATAGIISHEGKRISYAFCLQLLPVRPVSFHALIIYAFEQAEKHCNQLKNLFFHS